MPKIFNLRRDPYERADITSNTYYDWMISRAYVLVPAQAYVGKFLETFKAFPPRQKPASFTVGGQMEALGEGALDARRRHQLADRRYGFLEAKPRIRNRHPSAGGSNEKPLIAGALRTPFRRVRNCATLEPS